MKSIIFNSEMIKAILEDKKTQTRRVMKPQPISFNLSTTEERKALKKYLYFERNNSGFCCNTYPYGKVGDKLWVRETWGMSGLNRIEYKAFPKDGKDFRCVDRWRSPLFMFRKFSRITLEITNIKIEKLQDINEKDAIAEGIDKQYAHGKALGWRNYMWHGDYGQYGMGNKKSDSWKHQYSTYSDNPVGCFSSLWESINYNKKGKQWKDNPFVWVIGFKRIK